jgi:GTPase Era involved in 16S rRNA processing
MIMFINAINTIQQYDIKSRVVREKHKADQPAIGSFKDTFEAAEKKTADRDALINTIRKKIKLGYYNSESVVDDLSDSFAKAMNPAG